MIYFCIPNAILTQELFTLGMHKQRSKEYSTRDKERKEKPTALGMGKGKGQHTGELQHSTPSNSVRGAWGRQQASSQQDGGQGSEEGEAAQASGAAASAAWETPASFCGNPRLRYRCFNPQLVNPAKHLIQLHTPKCSWGITRIYNRESISVERRSLNCNLTEL